MRIALIGLGAVGSVYGSLLAKNPTISLTILADQERCIRYKNNPLIINGETPDFHYARPIDIAQPVDLVLFATKGGQLQSAIELAKQVSDSHTLFLSLLNGISSEQELLKHFPNEQVLYGMCNKLDAVRIDRSVSYHNAGIISFGEVTNKIIAPHIQELADIFQQSGICCEVPENMQQKIWYKFMVNVGVNQVSAVINSSYGVFRESEHAAAAVRAAMHEVILVANAEGVPLTVDLIDEWFKHVLPELASNGKTSMLQDIEQKRLTEVELFAGTVRKLGAKHHIAVPVNELLYQLITTLEYKNIHFD